VKASVTATRVAIEMVERLSVEHGPLAFFQSGGCCDGSASICLKDGELPPGANDLLLCVIADTPFYVDREQYERLGSPVMLDRRGFGAGRGLLAVAARRALHDPHAERAGRIVRALPQQVQAFARTTSDLAEASLQSW
jgi:uncharacterized protein (DUF779 family)